MVLTFHSYDQGFRTKKTRERRGEGLQLANIKLRVSFLPPEIANHKSMKHQNCGALLVFPQLTTSPKSIDKECVDTESFLKKSQNPELFRIGRGDNAAE